MTTLNKDSMMVSAAMTDAFGASVPTTEAGLEKEYYTYEVDILDWPPKE